MGEASVTQVPEAVPPERPFKWKISEEELLAMPSDQRALYLNEKLSRIYDALMLQVEGAQSSGEIDVRPEDILAILHPEREDRQEYLRDQDSPDH